MSEYYRQLSIKQTKDIGEEPGFWDRFRNQPPPVAEEYEITVAIIDALTQEGVAAWHGDATGCVSQMLMAQMEARVKAEALAADRLDLLRRWEALTKRCVFCNGYLSWIGKKKPDMTGHADGCKLAEELGDD